MSARATKHSAAIAIANHQRARKINSRLLKQITAAALEELKINRAELGIVLPSAKEMALLNQKFLGHDGATDVITFDYGSSESTVHSPQPTARGSKGERRGTGNSGLRTELNGEIFICVAEAMRQCQEFGTSWQSEVVRYVVHGILHLAGHDDLKAAARKKMKREEGRILGKLSRRFALSRL